MSDYDWEELADLAIEDIKDFIDTENLFVQNMHTLEDTATAVAGLVEHLQERIPETMPHVEELLGEIDETFAHVQQLIDSGVLGEAKIMEEEAHILQQLEEDVRNKEWRAVKHDITDEADAEKRALRFEMHELGQLRRLFKKLAGYMKRNSLIEALAADSAGEYEGKLLHYFREIYGLVRTYERLYSDLADRWEKEKHLYDKLE